MSDVKHAFRLMVIDIEADKVVIDEFCDAIVAGTAKKAVDGDGTDGKGSHSIISMAKSDLKSGVAACMAAEEATKKTKEKVAMSFLEKCGNSQNAVEFLKKMLEEDLADGGV